MEHGIILVRPETSGNIGAVCRAMATAGLKDLSIVGEKHRYNEDEILKFALKAYSIWEHAHFFAPQIDGLRTALSKYSFACGTTRRTGKKRTSSIQTIAQCARSIGEQHIRNAAFVFGNERTGLMREELALCNMSVYIPTSNDFGSLNLSHAVQIVCYELFLQSNNMANGSGGTDSEQVTLEEVFRTSENIISFLKLRGFFKVGGAQENEQFFNTILAKANLNPFELSHINQIVKKLLAKEHKEQ
ncbi:MAG: RNA methyltransferase [Spirochaetaceae bacterium]|nr:RNA methyltransferase [Spirochaetaceae bacterium]